MKQYRIPAEGLKAIQKRNFKKAIPVLVIAMAAGVAIAFINSTPDSKSFTGFSFPLLIIILGLAIYRTYKRNSSILKGYSINISSNLITREQTNLPTLSLYFNEITAVIKLSNGSLAIKGRQRTDTIVIPQEIENFEEIEATLNAIIPVTSIGTTSNFQRYSWLFIVFALACMISVYTVSNKLIVGISGVIVITVIVWGFVSIQRNKQIDTKVKKNSWWMLMMLASVLFTMIAKLFLL